MDAKRAVGASVLCLWWILGVGSVFGQTTPGGAGRSGGEGSPTVPCPDLGVVLVHTVVQDVGEQDCPALRVGPGIPFVGQIEIFSIGTRSCPVLQEQIPAHNAPVEKIGFRIAPGDAIPIKIRLVSCSSAENLLVIGTSGCVYGSWAETLTQVVDWREYVCE
jgi:hypothetical protein